jgi:hypothetical protein
MLSAVIAAIAALLIASPAFAHWDGPSDPVMHAWFDGLASGKGLCCSFADGLALQDIDWDTGGPNNAYRVRLLGAWVVVPAESVVTVPNKYGSAVVWPVSDGNGHYWIRCFMPGTLS